MKSHKKINLLGSRWKVHMLDHMLLRFGGLLCCWPDTTWRILAFISFTCFSISATTLFLSWLITINCCSSLSASSCFSFLFSRHLLEASLLRSRILRNFWADASSSVRSAAAGVAEGWGVIGRTPDGRAGRPLFLHNNTLFSECHWLHIHRVERIVHF